MIKDSKKVGRFHILLDQLLGSGTFAKTYKAYKGKDKSVIYACKVINKQEMKQICENTEYIISRVQEEFRLLKKLNHRNIVHFEDSEETKNNLYLFFEYCDQGTLEKYIRSHRFQHNLTEQKRIVKEIIDGCRYLQGMGIVHRDIKPQNILIKGDMIKIADFGLAKILDEDDSYRSTLVGTFHYMAPEILTESKTKQTKKCDVWSVGVTIYEMANGFLPFEISEKTVSPHAMLQKLSNFPFQSAQEKTDWKDIKDDLFRQLIRNMLVFDSKKRISFQEAKHIVEKHQGSDKKESDRESSSEENQNLDAIRRQSESSSSNGKVLLESL